MNLCKSENLPFDCISYMVQQILLIFSFSSQISTEISQITRSNIIQCIRILSCYSLYKNVIDLWHTQEKQRTLKKCTWLENGVIDFTTNMNLLNNFRIVFRRGRCRWLLRWNCAHHATSAACRTFAIGKCFIGAVKWTIIDGFGKSIINIRFTFYFWFVTFIRRFTIFNFVSYAKKYPKIAYILFIPFKRTPTDLYTPLYMLFQTNEWRFGIIRKCRTKKQIPGSILPTNFRSLCLKL